MTAKCLIFWIFAITISVLPAVTSLAQAAGRSYVVRPDQPHRPTEIKVGDVRDQPVLKDPTLLRKASLAPAPVVERKAQPRLVPAKMHFKKMIVKGRESQPRVVFERERLDVPMVGEPMPGDFLERTAADTSLDLLEQGGY